MLSHFVDNFDEITLKGEFVLVLEGAQEQTFLKKSFGNLSRRNFTRISRLAGLQGNWLMNINSQKTMCIKWLYR